MKIEEITSLSLCVCIATAIEGVYSVKNKSSD